MIKISKLIKAFFFLSILTHGKLGIAASIEPTSTLLSSEKYVEPLTITFKNGVQLAGFLKFLNENPPAFLSESEKQLLKLQADTDHLLTDFPTDEEKLRKKQFAKKIIKLNTIHNRIFGASAIFLVVLILILNPIYMHSSKGHYQGWEDIPGFVTTVTFDSIATIWLLAFIGFNYLTYEIFNPQLNTFENEKANWISRKNQDLANYFNGTLNIWEATEGDQKGDLNLFSEIHYKESTFFPLTIVIKNPNLIEWLKSISNKVEDFETDIIESLERPYLPQEFEIL